MNRIAIEVPKTTNYVLVDVPCRNGDLIWSFEVIFTDIEHTRKKLVTICSDGCDNNTEATIESKIVSNESNPWCDFEYVIDKEDLNAHIELKVFFSKVLRVISVDF